MIEIEFEALESCIEPYGRFIYALNLHGTWGTVGILLNCFKPYLAWLFAVVLEPLSGMQMLLEIFRACFVELTKY